MRSAVLVGCMILCVSGDILVPFANRPPSIDIEPNENVYFKPGESVELPCVAYGYPEVRYTWKKNGIDFKLAGNDTRIEQLAISGTIVINQPERDDEGIFQCFAENEFGKSMTRRVTLREGRLAKFPTGPAEHHRLDLGVMLTLDCIPPYSLPRAQIGWILRDSSGRDEALPYSNRLVLDPEGRLHFTNTKAEDSREGKAYVCMAFNYFLNHTEYDHQHYIQTYGSIELQIAPMYMWTTPSYVLALVGEKLKMKCIFAGNPTPEVYWDRINGEFPPDIDISQGGQQITIPFLKESDAGTYECYGNNSIGPIAQRAINLHVESKPTWLHKPKDIETVVGASSTFLCQAEGHPVPKTQWFVNAVPINDSQDDSVLSDRFLKPNDMNVTIYNVTLADLFVIQCNISSNHGYLFADVYHYVYVADNTSTMTGAILTTFILTLCSLSIPLLR